MIEKLIKRVFDYVNSVLNGEINACKKLKQACQRFLDDVERLKSEDFPYYFDATELEEFYEWARMFKHHKGILAGKPIELTDFQLFLAANIFCWKKKSNNARRFRKVYIQLARKNAKTQFLALIASYVAFLSDEQEEVYIAGWSREQSSICYEEILSQIRTCELLKGKYTDSYGRIRHIKSGSIIQPLSREARKTGDGKSPSVAIIEEYHAHETSEIYDVMASGMGARPNGMIVIITTAGFDLSRPCFTEYEYVSRILDPDDETENDEYFGVICELDPDDDVKDKSNWLKPNPILATYDAGIEYLEGELRTALDVPEKMRSFLTKNMNIWVDQKDNVYIPLKKFRQCAGKIPDLTGASVYVGVDLSATEDLTSVSFVFPLEGKYYVKSHSFIPGERMKEKMQIDKVRYDLWEQQGYLTATDGEIINYEDVEAYIINQISTLQPSHVEICYDPWNARHLAQRLEERGLNVIEIPQSIRHLSIPTKSFREAVYEKKVVHDDNPVLNWAVSNAVVKMDDQENIMISKKASKNRIDPIASVINAFARAMHHAGNIDLNEYILSDEFSF
jgi:phage terminase large subunit-like protein